MAHYGNILEEELKNKVAHDYFAEYDNTQIIGKIDFCIAIPRPRNGGGGIYLKLNHLCGQKRSQDRKKTSTNRLSN